MRIKAKSGYICYSLRKMIRSDHSNGNNVSEKPSRYVCVCKKAIKSVTIGRKIGNSKFNCDKPPRNERNIFSIFLSSSIIPKLQLWFSNCGHKIVLDKSLNASNIKTSSFFPSTKKVQNH